MTKLARKLGLSEREESRLHKNVGPIKDVGEFLRDALAMLDKTGVTSAISLAAPWLALSSQTAAAIAAPIAFVAKLVHRLTGERDPSALAYLACATAYERSVEQAITAVGAPTRERDAARTDLRHAFDALGASADHDLTTLRLDDIASSSFVIEADRLFDAFAAASGYDEPDRRRLIGDVHSRFVVNLKTLLSHGRTREAFAPFAERLLLGSGEEAARATLAEHAEAQRRMFEELPVLGTEAFPLSAVYADLDCGSLTWATIRDGDSRNADPIDPFSERDGGRKPLLETVLSLIGDATFKDAIVIQGVAGAGKSAFTLRLSAELIHQGLRPIRVRMRDIPFDRHAGEAIRQAIRLGDDSEPTRPRARGDLFLGGAIWSEAITYRRARICPYVVILDGWDEISVSVTEGFRVRLDRMLEQVRSELLSNRDVPVRVIVTGRPSTALTEGSFLRDETAVLTMRPFRPEQLDQFVKMLSSALASTDADASTATRDARRWSLDPKRFRPVITQYRREFKANASGPVEPRAARSSMEVLGLPLLAHIALRLMSSYEGPLVDLVKSPTALYRHLVDLTCERAGQFGRQALDPAARPKLAGRQLRDLLRRTAASISANGEESIAYDELAARLRLDGSQLAERAAHAADDNLLTTLMISFYFKGGRRELGCEFAHKSFREYLFAEAIVEALKELGHATSEPLAPRAPYWRELAEGDPRLALSRALGELLAPQWLSLEVVGHVEQLVTWEVQRAETAESTPREPGRATDPLRLDAWERVRDALADLWDWWGEGVHLRPQPSRRDRGAVALDLAYADKLVDWSAPQAIAWGDAKLAPARVTTMDAHLGDGLFRLAALAHFQVARQRGLFADGAAPDAVWSHSSDVGRGARRYQTLISKGDRAFIVFAPSGDNGDWFANYVMRINAAGWRPGGPFPLGVDLRAADLREASFTIPAPQTPPRRGLMRHANLRGANASGSSFFGVVLRQAMLREAILDRAEMNGAELCDADFTEASLSRVDLRGADLRGATLRFVDLSGANLRGASLVNADLSGADLRGADLSGADFTGANLTNARLYADATSGAALSIDQLASAATVTTRVELRARG
jgi:hypothetical protein